MTREFVLLELCAEYSIDPLRMDEIPDEIKIAMIAKHDLEVERNNRIQKENQS